MNFTWQVLTIIAIMVLSNDAGNQSPARKTKSLKNWRIVESLAEEYPYIVALLNRTKDYMCTGIIVNKETVLTSGSCIDPALYYISVGVAVLTKHLNRSLFEIASSKLHTDYVFDLKVEDPNITRLHSNIGLVFSVLPTLVAYISPADMGKYFASELVEKNLKVVGFGKIGATNTIVLQQQSYHQTACANPRWYYCVCGFEYTSYSKTYDEEFGKGAPVFLGHEIIGIAATPCGTLELAPEGLKYNIFTVIGPYLPWVEKKHLNISAPAVFRAQANKAYRAPDSICVYVLFIISKVIY